MQFIWIDFRKHNINGNHISWENPDLYGMKTISQKILPKTLELFKK